MLINLGGNVTKKLDHNIINIILIMIGVILPGELFQNYATQFTDFYDVTFYLQPGISKEEMLNDIEKCASQNNVSVFLVEEKIINSFKAEVIIYCDENAKKYLKSEYSIIPGKFNSIFSGEVSIYFEKFINASDNVVNSKIPKYYVIGDYDDIINFRVDTIDTYGGKFPSVSDYGFKDDTVKSMIVLWIIIGVIICYISFYTFNVLQKEIMIRISMGQSRIKIFLKLFLADICFIIFPYIAFVYALKNITMSVLFWHIAVIAIIAILIVNSAIYLRIFRLKVKSAFARAEGQNSLLRSGYIIKIVSCICMMLLISVLANVIYEYREYVRQENFFQNRKDYNYVEFKSTSLESGISDFEQMFYKKHYDSIELRHSCIELGEEDRKVILMNSASLPSLCEEIPEIQEAIDDDIFAYILYPENEILPEEWEEFIFMHAEEMYRYQKSAYDGGFSCKSVPYKEGREIIVIDDDTLMKSRYLSNQIILFINDSEYSLEPSNIYIRQNDMMVNISSDEIKSIAYKNSLECEVTNCYEVYENNKMILKRTMILNIIFFSLVFVLEVFLNILIIKTEYKINAIELALKKTLGYTAFQKYRKMYITTVVSFCVSMFVSVLMVNMLSIGDYKLAIFINFVMIFIDFMIVYIYSSRYERKNINQILKGGNV